jgi:hypothetical protein
MRKNYPEHFPDHYYSLERERRLEILQSPHVSSKFKMGVHASNIMEGVRNGVFRRLWKNPAGLVVALTSDDLEPENAFALFSEFSNERNSEKGLRNLIICLRYNDLLPPYLLAQLVGCFSEYRGDEIACYLGLLHYFQFYMRNSMFFDDEVVSAFEKTIPEFMDGRRAGLVQYLQMN